MFLKPGFWFFFCFAPNDYVISSFKNQLQSICPSSEECSIPLVWLVPPAMEFGNQAKVLWSPQHWFMPFEGATCTFQLTMLQKLPRKCNRKYITFYYLNKINHSYELVLGCCVIPLSFTPTSVTFLKQSTCYSLVAWMIWKQECWTCIEYVPDEHKYTVSNKIGSALIFFKILIGNEK